MNADELEAYLKILQAPDGQIPPDIRKQAEEAIRDIMGDRKKTKQDRETWNALAKGGLVLLFVSSIVVAMALGLSGKITLTRATIITVLTTVAWNLVERGRKKIFGD